MKIVFNKRAGRGRSLRSVGLVRAVVVAVSLGIGLGVVAPRPARAQAVYFTTRQLLADFFHSSQSVTWRKLALGAAEKQRLKERLGYAPGRDAYTFYVAESNGHVDGYALIDDEMGQHQPITFAVKLSPAGVVERQEIVVYRESRGDEIRDERFRKQFVGKSAKSALEHDIVAISGATISSKAMAVGVKRALALFDELQRAAPVAPARPVGPVGAATPQAPAASKL